VRILLAPDKFKDALSAALVCEALAAGVQDALPDAEVVSCPLADGGEGTGRVVADALLHASEQTAIVLDPLGRERMARWWWLPDRLAGVIEMAEASGLTLLAPHERRAGQTTSFGTGQLIRTAVETGARHIMLAVGGSATVDGGAGCLQALGWRLFDAGGRELTAPACGNMLPRVAALRRPARGRLMDIMDSVGVEVLCDVDHPLLGPRGAAPSFAPQKGASPTEVEELTGSLAVWADALENETGRKVRWLPGSGAAGGLPAGVAAALEADLVPGFERVADLVDLNGKLRRCDWCLTGEGRLDEQTSGGKVVAGVARRANAVDVPVVAFVGGVRTHATHAPNPLAHALGLRDIMVITPEDMPLAEALPATAQHLRQAVARYRFA